jgi:ribonuclease VapC
VILDSSAIVSVVFQEPGYGRVLEAIASAPRVAIGASTLAEATVILSARLGRDARGLMSRFVLEADMTVVPFTDAHFGTAVDAWRRFGRGRDPAGLDFGDCLAYATAVLAGEPLLFTGDKFARTDVAAALRGAGG